MLHAAVRWIRIVYPVVVFCVYVMAFFVAFAMVFMLPIGALGVVFVSLMSLVPVVIVWALIRLVERSMAIRMLRRGVCPVCHEQFATSVNDLGDVAFTCAGCGARFTAKGEDILLPDPSPT